MVENQEIVIGSDMIGLRGQKYSHVNENTAKGKRTKRQRPSSPLALTMATGSGSTSSIGVDVSSNETLPYGGYDHHPTVSPKCSSSASIELVQKNGEEEEDMANCLILLARGHQSRNQAKRAYSSQESNDTTTSNKNSGVSCDSYQCKTCNRSFPSFQALGGHRASHKKLPKICTSDSHKKFLSLNVMENCIREQDKLNVITSTSLSLQIPTSGDVSASGKFKIHECSICGAEFSSGQALGGHMRRHRPMVPAGSTSTATTTAVPQSIDGGPHHEEAPKRSKNMLQLDLNLPAPEDRESMYAFGPREQVFVFSSSPWVDCHY